MIAAAQAAVVSGNVEPPQQLPSGADIDTYCGVDGSGNPLPKYFATGKGSSFCTTFLPIFQAVGSAGTPAAVLAALDANKTQIALLATSIRAARLNQSQGQCNGK